MRWSAAATLLASPAASCVDAISIHPYRRGAQPPETALTDYEEVRAFIAAHTPRGQKPLPIISSEWGYSLTETTPEQQAAYAVRMPLVNALAGVPLGNWYEWKDSRQGALNREAHFGLLDYQGDDKFSAETVKDLWPQMANAVVVKRVPVAETDSFVLLLRQPDGRLQLAAWQGVARLVKEVVLQVEEEGAARAFPLTLFPRLIDLKTTEPELPKNLRVSTVSAGAENLRP
ncbi:MAG: hypothetical protein HGA90_03170 [Alphaproteobacteria bacterium]|nr:hypothetical protein [Alphaproteobacteria bacterium]